MKTRLTFIFIFLFLTSIITEAQSLNNNEYFTIYGTIRDASNGETLIGASVFIAETNKGSATNNYGFYSLKLKKGSYVVQYQYMGYKKTIKEISLQADIRIDINLQALDNKLKEVIVTGEKNRVKETQTSVNTINIERVKSITSITGEPDVLKSLQLLPGVQTAGEGTSNLIVRGGSYDQNLILLDEAPVYNPSHALGFFSIFQANAIKNVKLYKGGFPAKYGSRLSAVIDISMKEGNMKKFAVTGSFGLLASSLSVEGPIIKDRLSFIVSSRYSYAGATMNLIGGKIAGNLLQLSAANNFNDQNEIHFYDLNAKINYKINEKNHIYLSAYNGGDHFFSYSINNNNQLDWGNHTTTFRWNHLFSSQLFSNLSVYYSNYNYAYSIFEDVRCFDWKSDIKEIGLKYDFDYFINQNNHLKFGLQSSFQLFNPGEIYPMDTASIVIPYKLNKKKGMENAFYIQNEQHIGEHLSLNYGIRYSSYTNLGAATVYKYDEDMENIVDSTVYGSNEIINFYHGLEPRLTINYLINNKQSIKTSYSYTQQYLHLLSNSTIGLPTDIWMPPDSYTKPSSSHQFTIGYYRTLFSEKFELTTELYYKTLENIIDFKDNADLFMNENIETQILSGGGKSYGVEFMFEKKSGKLSGWLSYTFSKTNYQIDGINRNKEYSPRFDIRHNLSINLAYSFNKKWSINSTFKYTSGGFVTIPAGSYVYNGVAFPYFTERNGYKLPAYHRFDIAFKYQSLKNANRKRKTYWMFGIYNVYDRKNIYALFVQNDANNFQNSGFQKMYLGGIIPSISYNFRF